MSKVIHILGSALVVELSIPKDLVDKFEEGYGKNFRNGGAVHGFSVPRSIQIYSELPDGCVYATATLAGIDEFIKFNLFVSAFCENNNVTIEERSED